MIEVFVYNNKDNKVKSGYIKKLYNFHDWLFFKTLTVPNFEMKYLLYKCDKRYDEKEFKIYI